MGKVKFHTQSELWQYLGDMTEEIYKLRQEVKQCYSILNISKTTNLQTIQD